MTEASDPRIVGRYVLRSEIASGGMASVHLGRALGAAGFTRRVAIKRLHAHFASDPSFVAMFVDEARLASRIHHPNVVSTLDVVSRDGELFVVMEYVEGVSLAELRRAAAQRHATMPIPVATAIVIGMLEGLHAAHEAESDSGTKLGLVHRDVSPQNVLVGVDGIPRLIDFGVAKAAGRLQTTREGQLKGKLAYMAREQLERAGVDRRTDVYAASVVLWELLADRRLFRADTEAQVVTLVLRGANDPPSAFVPDVPEALDRIVMRGLSHDPDARYASAQEMALVIRAAVAPASAAEVAAWVRDVGREALQARAAKEQDPTPETLPGTAATSAEPKVAPRGGARAWGAAAVVAAGAAGTLALVLVGRRAPDVREPSVEAQTTLSPDPAPAPPPSSPAPGAVPDVVASTPVPPHPAPVVGSRSRAASAIRPAASAGACDPPYTVDAQGVHQFKRECVVGR